MKGHISVRLAHVAEGFISSFYREVGTKVFQSSMSEGHNLGKIGSCRIFVLILFTYCYGCSSS